jgi:broad specificity phosphatase PhoE
MMPHNLYLVRHGESEGNVANQNSREGDHSAFSEAFKERSSSKWRLTDKGIWEAQMAGLWFMENTNRQFGRYYVSEYARAIETAIYLNLPDARWYQEFCLRERDWGQLDLMSVQEREEKYFEEMRRRERDGFFYASPGGESMATLCLRIDKILGTLHRECTDKDVIIVCHGEVIWAFRIRIERLTEKRFNALYHSDKENSHEKINNCQIIQYTRRDPKDKTIMSSHVDWMRSICPWDLSKSSNEWTRIQRPKYSNEDLLKELKDAPRIIC